MERRNDYFGTGGFMVILLMIFIISCYITFRLFPLDHNIRPKQPHSVATPMEIPTVP